MACILACIYCELICNMEGWEVVFQDSAEVNLSLPTTTQGFLQSVAI